MFGNGATTIGATTTTIAVNSPIHRGPPEAMTEFGGVADGITTPIIAALQIVIITGPMLDPLILAFVLFYPGYSNIVLNMSIPFKNLDY